MTFAQSHFLILTKDTSTSWKAWRKKSICCMNWIEGLVGLGIVWKGWPATCTTCTARVNQGAGVHSNLSAMLIFPLFYLLHFSLLQLGFQTPVEDWKYLIDAQLIQIVGLVIAGARLILAPAICYFLIQSNLILIPSGNLSWYMVNIFLILSGNLPLIYGQYLPAQFVVGPVLLDKGFRVSRFDLQKVRDPEWVKEQLIEWVCACGNEWVSEFVSEWVIGGMGEWVRHWVSEWVSDWPLELSDRDITK